MDTKTTSSNEEYQLYKQIENAIYDGLSLVQSNAIDCKPTSILFLTILCLVNVFLEKQFWLCIFRKIILIKFTFSLFSEALQNNLK